MASRDDVAESGSDIVQRDEEWCCQPCKSDGATVAAVGYCKNCQEYLCQRCYDGHLIPSVTRKHKLERIKESVKGVGNQKVCSDHEDKPAEYHCPSHAFIGCHVCIIEHHRACQDVKYIPTVAKDVTSTEEYRQFNARLAGITAKCKDMASKVTQCRTAAEKSSTEALATFKAYKRELLDELDRQEKRVKEEVEKFQQEESARITSLSDQTKSLLSEAQGLTSAIEVLQNQGRYDDLYKTMVTSREKLHTMETTTRKTHNMIYERKLVCEPDTGIVESLKESFERGMLRVTGESTRIHKLDFLRDVNVKCSSDTTTCRITGAVQISKNKIIFTDNYNRKVKLYDTAQNKVVSELGLPGTNPLGVCKVSSTQVAVGLNCNKVALVNVSSSLSLDREISVRGSSCGVGYCDGKLIVSYHSPNKVEILDLQGTVLKVVDKDQQGQSLFHSPYGLCVNPYSKLVYVSNCFNHEVVCLRLDGTVVGRYRDSELRDPWQVIVDSSGTVYVCGYSSHNVHQVTSDCKKVRLLLTQADGLNSPASICYEEEEGRVYIGQYNNNNVKVFKVTCEEK